MYEWSQWPIGSIPNPENSSVSVVLQELAAMKVEFDICAALRAKYQSNPSTSGRITMIRNDIGDVSLIDLDSTPNVSSVKEHKRTKRYSLPRIFGRSQRPSQASNESIERSPMSQSSGSSSLSISTAKTSISATLSTQKSHGENPSVIELANQQREDAESLQSSSTLRQKATWIIRDREDYKESVRKITESNDLIESIVRAWTLKTIKLKEEEAYNPLPLEAYSTMYSLSRLHTALRQSNIQNNGNRITLGVKLIHDHTRTRETIATGFTDLKLRDDSCVFMLQSFDRQEVSQSQLLLAESLMYPHRSPPETSITTNKQSKTLDAESFTLTSEISVEDDPHDIHRVYTDTTSSWAPAKNLTDLLQYSAVTPSQATRYRLAALIAINHLHFANITHPNGKSDPNNFRYFDWKEEAEHLDEATIIEDEDRLLNIYYFAGFGSSPPKESTRSLGAVSGTTPVYNPQIVELGLLLYQVGCWQHLDYNNLRSNSAREKLRNLVSDRLFELHRKTGLRYAETVQKCLDWKVKPVQERANDQPQFYEEVVECLVGLDEAIRARSSAIF